ncbi:MAG: glycoside hydrolase family 97 catalytic domain-containing protein [Kiritimatiellae bacterium]|nr:glycoside hydrolase family 97 catalytic domain-containing protein [Kiritimatiellia bacterium]
MNNSMSAFVSVALTIGTCAAVAADQASVSSPDGKNKIRLYANPLAYEVVRDGVTVVAKSEIGMAVDGKRLGDEDATGRVPPVVMIGKRDGVADAPVYKKSKVDLSANEAYADFGAWGVRLVARNDGVAYRFETKMPGRIRVESEEASLAPPVPDVSCWGYQTGRFGEEESVPFSLKASQIDFSDKKRYMPFGWGMVYLPFAYEAGGKFVLVMESDVRDYPILNFGSYGNGAFTAKFAGAPKRVRKHGAGLRVLEREKWLVETEGTRTFPWRVFVLADAPAKFCEADIVWALAPAQDTGVDFSWVRPGKVAWDWWNWFDNGRKCDTKGYERFIDFAAKNGLEYVVLDWYGYEVRFGFDIWKPCPAVDVDHLVKYARERGVDLWHWMAFHQVYGDEERVASHFAKVGIKGFKVDFLDRGDADVARFMEKFADACARNRMHVEYHGAYRPTGLQRRYPNVLNYEGIHGQEWVRSGLRNVDDKGMMFSDVAACYLRMSAGPMDYTPGAMLNHGVGPGDRAQDKRNQPGTFGTRCRQMAQVALYEAPLQMLCDSPTNYEKNMECFAFMAKIPTVWKNTVGLAGTPDRMFVAARETRDGAWYAGGITTAEARDCTLDTSFLGAGEWAIEIFRDAGDAKEDAQRFVHETRKVKAGEKIRVHMAPGGGFVARFSRPQG